MEENKGLDPTGKHGVVSGGFKVHERGYDRSGRQVIFFNCGESCHLERFCTKTCTLCTRCYSVEHVTKYFPYLMKKWEDNRGRCNMVTVEPREKNIGKDMAQVNIVTCGGSHTIEDILGQCITNIPLEMMLKTIA